MSDDTLRYEIRGNKDITVENLGGKDEFYAAVKEVFDYANKSNPVCIDTLLDRESGIVRIRLKGVASLVADIYKKMENFKNNQSTEFDIESAYTQN